MKKISAICLALLLLLSLCACSAYRSSYSTTMLVRTEGDDHCQTSFSSLKGILVMHATVAEPDADGTIHYEAELGEGELTVYYDVSGTKALLFTLKGGQRLDSRGGKVAKGEKVTFIIETVGTAKEGDIELEFD